MTIITHMRGGYNPFAVLPMVMVVHFQCVDCKLNI